MRELKRAVKGRVVGGTGTPLSPTEVLLLCDILQVASACLQAVEELSKLPLQPDDLFITLKDDKTFLIVTTNGIRVFPVARQS